MSSTVDAEEIGGTFSELESPDRRHFDLLNSFGGGTLPSSPQNFLRPSRISNSPSFRGSQRSDSPVAPLVVLPESTRDFWTRSLSPRRATTLDSNGESTDQHFWVLNHLQLSFPGENRPQFATFRPASQARGSPLRTENFLNSTAATGLSSPQRM